MNQRYMLLQSWERAALNGYARQNGFRLPSEGAYWHTFGILLRDARSGDNFAPSHFAGAITRRPTCIVTLSPPAKIENRLHSLFAE